jgi:eukaryotic-like serine/threonine-protein kinase
MIVPVPEPPAIEKYEVQEEIGHGGMATVYRAHDRRLGRDVAVKVIHRHLRESLEIAARFVSEARAVAKLKHPNIVEVYDVSDEDAAERYLVVELVRGPTLRKLLAETGHMPAEVAVAIGLEIGAALDHAHEAGVVHRDVKPENVLVELRESPASNRTSQERTPETSGARIKITDFGIAKLLDAQGVTSTGQVLGSPAHMAPEQIEGGEVGPRSDVFGLGVLLYECMVGRLPFDGKNPAQVLRKVLDGSFTPPDRARPTVGARLSRVVEKALSREADHRFASAAELCDALAAELELVGMTDHRRELAEFLADPKAYVADYEPRIVKRLVELGKRARAARDLPAAAACFNRALAFRPDDTELIRQVAGLAQTERMRRFTVRAGAIALGSLTLGAVAYGVTRAIAPPAIEQVAREAEPKPVLDPSAPLQPEPRVVERVPRTPASALEEPEKVKAPRVTGPLIPNEPKPKQKTRKVVINVQGSKAAIVRVDGEMVNWFQGEIELPIGARTFTVSPPDEDCCEVPPPSLIKIVEGDDAQPIGLRLPFRKATVALAGPTGAEATCGLLFRGPLAAGQSRAVDVASGTDASCNISGPDGPPKTSSIRLKPGAYWQLSWP